MLFCLGDGGRKRTAGLAIFRHASDGAGEVDRRRCQYRHVPADLPAEVLTVYGLDESDLGDMRARLAQAHGRAGASRPEPLRNVFIRSDQYSFIRQGVPSLAMKVGFEPGLARGSSCRRNG